MIRGNKEMQTKIKKVIIPIIFLIILSTPSVFLYKAKSGSSGLVGYWKFDEGSGNVAYDSSRNTNDGTVFGASWTSGISNGALQFDGVNDYVGISSSNSLTVSGNQLTVELWFRPATTIDGNYPYTIIIDKGNEYGFQVNHDGLVEVHDGKIRFYMGLDLSGWSWQGIETLTNRWTANTWYLLVGTYDGNSMKIYVNGVLENSRALSGNLAAQGSYPLSIGSYTLGDHLFFNGAIDEVKIDNYARTLEEILSDYNSFMQSSPTPFWIQWWFWAIIGLGIVATVSLFTTVHYRQKALKTKETKTVQSKPASEQFIICPNCKAQLPADSKFCGKCGTSLQ